MGSDGIRWWQFLILGVVLFAIIYTIAGGSVMDLVL